MGFLRKAVDFVARPTQSRTMGLAVMLVLVAAVSLTVTVAQQQQSIRQRAAAGQCSAPTDFSCSITVSNKIRGDWTKSTGVNSANYLFQACPPEKDFGDPNCISSSRTSGTFNYIHGGLDKGTLYTLAAKLSDSPNPNTCIAPSLWSNPDKCTIPTPTPTKTPTATLTPTPAPTNTPTLAPGQPTPAPGQCAAPTDLFCSIAGTNAIKVNWTGQVPTTYLLRACPLGKNFEDASCISSGLGADSWNVVYGLQQGTTYDLAVRVAVNQPICTAPGVWSNAVQCAILPAAIPTPILTPAPTSTPAPVNNVLLVLALNAQDIPIAPASLSAKLALYNLATNSLVDGALAAEQLFTRRPIPGIQYSANVLLTNLQQDKYFLVVRKDNMIAKAKFTVSKANETITVPTTTLVFGDINNDSDINTLDYNALRICWKQITKTESCLSSSDFNKDGVIDQIDYNTWLRGFAAWSKQGK